MSEQMSRYTLYNICKTLAIACMLLLTACQSVQDDLGDAGLPVGIGAFEMQSQSVITRAVNAGYHDFDATADISADSKLYGFIQNSADTYIKSVSTYDFTDGLWISGMRLLSYMPPTGWTYRFFALVTDNPAITSTMANNGAGLPCMTIGNVPAFSQYNIMLSSGAVLNGLTLTKGSYTAALTNDNHQVNFMMDNLMTALNLKILIDSKYNALREVVVKEVKISSQNAVYEAVATFTTSGITLTSSVTDAKGQDFTLSFDPGLQLTTTAAELGSCYLVPKLTGLTMTTTYDIYDKKGTLIRADQTAVNNLSQALTSDVMMSNSKINLTLKVAPTYLYSLSDGDLDNPGVTIIKN